jgi:hypothetical protein
VRVGVFDTQAVVVAYYRSTLNNDFVKGLIAERDRARTAGDAARVAELEKQGGDHQELAHRQLAGQARIDNILEHLKADMPAIGKEAGVDVIVYEPLYLGPEVVKVDITGQVVARFRPDEKTLAIIRQVREKSR